MLNKKKVIKQTKKAIKEVWYKRLIKTLIYNEERTHLSRTALMNFSFFLLVIVTWCVGMCLVLWKPTVEIPNSLLIFISSITGGGFLQYSFNKVVKKKGK